MKRISSIAILLAIAFQVTLASFQVNVTTTGAPLSARLYPRAVALSDGTIVVNGGTTTGSPAGTSAEIVVFNPTTSTYSPRTIASAPKLYAHAAAVDELDNVYYFGGNNGTARANALWTCNVALGDCTKLNPVAPVPGVRTLATLNYYKGSLVLFGGGDAPTFYNDVWQYNIEAGTWTNRVVQAAAGSPPGRTATCGAVSGDKLIVSGGSAVSGTYYRDVWILDLTTWTWTNATATMLPSVIHTDAACAVDGDYFLVYGGNSGATTISKTLDLFSISTTSWLAAYENTMGVARFGFAHAFVAGKWYLFGGSTSSTVSVNTLDVYTPDEPAYNTNPNTDNTENTDNTDNTDTNTPTVTVSVTVTETASTENTDTNLPTDNTDTPSSTEDTTITGVIPTDNTNPNTNTNTNTNTDDNDSSSVAVVASAVLVVCMSVLAL